jgi:sulfur relay (sulfurtransferase) complex TusBCD TusD component (DsrE family)
MTDAQKTSYLFIVNDPPYGSERLYSVLPLALPLDSMAVGTPMFI